VSHQYTMSYEVVAYTRWEAINAATALLRTEVRVRGLVRVEEVAPGLWKVSLAVEEDT
jgi:hypothetical protein